MTEMSGFQGHPQGVRILVRPLTGCRVLDKDLNLKQEVRTAALYKGATKTTEMGCEASPNELLHVQRALTLGPHCHVGIGPLWRGHGKPPHSA